ncbi:ATP-binding protein [Microbacterium sp. NPDC096154]|uniref:ATP-binding protein n=1 Tax=Microbacterium sp. NPDC096154 TaxID=3155549 RepID=UPI00331F075A
MAGEGGYELVGFAVPAELDRVHALLERVGQDHPHIAPMDLMLFETAVVEIANNVVEHGRPEGEVRWRFVVRVGEDAIEADLLDTGQEFAAEMHIGMPDEEAEGGRGLALAEAVLDEFTWERTDQGNCWRMVRRLGQGG